MYWYEILEQFPILLLVVLIILSGAAFLFCIFLFVSWDNEIIGGVRMSELSDLMKKTLMQIGFGVTFRSVQNGGHAAAFFDENNERVDGRSIIALQNRGLVWGATTGGYSLTFYLRLTENGETLFEEFLEEESRAKWGV
ncbi:MAG: hypothetical protein ACYSYL_21820 [Planctomycetota bacterium]